MRFNGTVRYFRPEQKTGLAVVDIPGPLATRLGGLKQMRVQVRARGVEFTSNTMPAGGGVLALSLSRKALDAIGVKVGQSLEVEIQRLGGS